MKVSLLLTFISAFPIAGMYDSIRQQKPAEDPLKKVSKQLNSISRPLWIGAGLVLAAGAGFVGGDEFMRHRKPKNSTEVAKKQIKGKGKGSSKSVPTF